MESAVSSVTANDGRRLETPSREALLADYTRTESICKALLLAESIAGLMALAWILTNAPRPFGAMPWIAGAIGALGVFRWLLHHIFLNKKRLEDIRPDAQFGVHTRDSLLKLTRDVFAQLGLKSNAARVFLTRAKDVNAQAVRCELWPGRHLFNGVFLNRSIIHLLDERELATVVGHELGHVFPYAPLLSRCYLVHALFAGAVSFAVGAAFNHPGVALFGPLAILWLLDWMIAIPHLRMSRGIEFLCDDFGAKAAGLLPALSSEFKLAVEQETRQVLLLRLFHSRQQGTQLSLRDMAEAYEEAVPFGKADVESFEKEIQKFTAEKQRNAQGISLGGFLQFLQGNDRHDPDDSTAGWLAELQKLNELPLVPVDRAAYLRGSGGWSHDAAANLADALEQHRTSVLVRLEDEINDRHATHPNPSRRILFLWHNRSTYPS